MDMKNRIEHETGTVVDVRSRGEFEAGSVPGAINIPLNEIPRRMDELKTLKGPLVLCCASGNRSGQAYQFLRGHGIKCVDAGSWINVNGLAHKTN